MVSSIRLIFFDTGLCALQTHEDLNEYLTSFTNTLISEEIGMFPNTRRFQKWIVQSCFLVVIGLMLVSNAAQGATVSPFYAGVYTATDLGPAPGVPVAFGGLTLKAGDPYTLLIGGDANTAAGKIYSIGLTRDASLHITG